MQFNDLSPDNLFRFLSRNQLAANPFDQFRIWFEEALAAGIIEPNAMALATASNQGIPSCRMVLMKNFDGRGLIFYTNYLSRKAVEIDKQAHASAVFYWRKLERQVILEGKVEKTSVQESKNYFHSRLRDKQLGAWASKQDAVLESREALDKEYERLESFYENQEIPLPPHWGGFILNPRRFEFWQGRPGRLHDRFQYALEDRNWKIDRLAP